MKKILLLLCCFPFFANAQTVNHDDGDSTYTTLPTPPPPPQTVSYGYDASGNRISRTIIMTMQATPPPQDTTETVVEEEAVTTSIQNPEEVEKSLPAEVYTDLLAQTPIAIYPNPTKGLLTVKIAELPQQSVSSLTLFDMLGKIITQQLSLTNENSIDISAQPPGTYIMQIVIDSHTTNWTIVKQ